VGADASLSEGGLDQTPLVQDPLGDSFIPSGMLAPDAPVPDAFAVEVADAE
jgi:hypothetical protein